MIFSLKNKIAVIGLIAAVLAGFGLYMTTLSSSNSNGGAMEMRYVADFSDDKNVVDMYSNLFVGKITKVAKQTNVQGIPVTLFEAEVVRNIKGDLKGTVVVLQTAGFRETEGGKKFASIGSGKLMEEGETYLLATGYDKMVTEQEGRDVYTILTHPNGSKLLSEDTELTLDQLKTVANNDQKVKAWEEVYNSAETE